MNSESGGDHTTHYQIDLDLLKEESEKLTLDYTMAQIGIFYGSSTGNTEFIAEKIQELIGDNAELYNVDAATKDDIKQYPYLIIGTSTWGIGDMQDDMEDFAEILETCDLKDKKIALFGLGDQDTYPGSFVDGIGALYDKLKGKTQIIAPWPITGYHFGDSEAVRKNKFVGLAIDQDNQAEKTNERLAVWIEELKKEFA